MKRILLCLLLAAAMVLTALPLIAGAALEVRMHEEITIAHPQNPDALFTITNVADICAYTLRADEFWALDVFYTAESTLSTNYYYLMAEYEFEDADSYFEWFLWPYEMPGWAIELPEGMNVSIEVVLEPGTEVSIDEHSVFHSGDGSLWHLGQQGSFFINFRSMEFMQDTLESYRFGYGAVNEDYERQLTEFAVSGMAGDDGQKAGDTGNPDDSGEPKDTADPVDSGDPEDPLDGAHVSLVEELALALELGFVPDAMIGSWTEPTSRLLAAEMIVMLVEVVLEMSIGEVAEEFDLDMDDAFSDTDDVAATFLKAAGISNGVDGVRYDPDGKFTRVMMVTMLGRLAENLFGINFSGYKLGTDVFIDLPASGYGYADRYVGWAAETGITLGQGAADRFAPGADLTNQATVAFTFRAYDVILEAVEQLEADGAADTDAILEGADDALKEELARALELGIIPDEVSGKWTQQTSNIILAEALVAMIEAVSGKTIADIAEENEFDVDLDAFSDTDSEAASFLHAANVMIGSSDGMFYPEELIGEHWILYLLLQFTAENIFGIDIAAEPVPAETFAGLPEWAQELAGLAGGWAVNAGILRISAAGDTEFAGVVQNQHLALYLLRMYEYLRG